MNKENLPHSWAYPPIQDCCELNPRLNKARIQASKTVHFVPMPAVEALVNKVDVSMLKSFSEIKKGYTPFQSNDVIFAKITPCMENGKVAVVPELNHDIALGSTEFHVIRPLGGISPLWFFYFLSSRSYRSKASQNMTGAVGQRRVPIDFISQSPVPIPPFAEQKRIIAKIEELFSELNTGEESLRRARRQLGVYRQSLLKQAFEGNLTAAWRARHPDLLKTSHELLAHIQDERAEIHGRSTKRGRNLIPSFANEEISLLPEIPKTWVWCRVGESGEVKLGRQRSPKHASGEHMRQYLRVANVFKERIDTSDVLSMNFTPAEFKTFQLRYGDILLNEGQSLEWVGRPAMFKDDLPNCCFQNTLVRYRALPSVDANYALRIFVHYLYKGRFQRIAKWTNNIAHLGAGRFAEIEFPLCSLPEQQEIVRLLDAQFEVIEQNEREIDAALKRSEALRQSILKKAFTGLLVAQDPADEPASVLLERIRAGRETKSPPIRRPRALRARTEIEVRSYPVRDMFHRGYFGSGFGTDWRGSKARSEEMLGQFFKDREGLPIWAFNRQTQEKEAQVDLQALHAWRCRVLDRASEHQAPPHDPAKLNDSFVRELAGLSVHKDGPVRAAAMLRKAGIAFVAERHLDKTYLDGAALAHPDGFPVIALTLRHDRLDNFWFTLFHELGHVIKHFAGGAHQSFADAKIESPSDKEREREADQFALEAFIPAGEWDHLRTLSRADEIRAAAKILRIHPAVLAGRLRREAGDYTKHGTLVGRGEVQKLFFNP